MSRIDEINEEITIKENLREELEKELKQNENLLKKIQKQDKLKESKARDRRLIQRGVVLENIIGDGGAWDINYVVEFLHQLSLGDDFRELLEQFKR